MKQINIQKQHSDKKHDRIRERSQYFRHSTPRLRMKKKTALYTTKTHGIYGKEENKQPRNDTDQFSDRSIERKRGKAI